METKIKLNNIFRTSAYAAMGLLMGLFAVAVFPSARVDTNAATAPVASDTTLSVSTNDIVIDVTPNSVSSFVQASTSVEILTDNYTGYTFRIAAENADTYDKLINESTNTYLSSITAATSEADFESNNALIGKFGYKPSKLNSVANTNFIPAPDTTGTIIEATNTANANNTANTYTISLGAKVDMSVIGGEYVNSYMYSVVANPTPYMIAYDANTQDTVTNLPATQANETADDHMILSSDTPVRAHYTFLGWCDGNTTNVDDTDTCDGDIYQPGDYFYLDQTANNSTTLKVMWDINKNRVDVNGRLDGVNSTDINGYGTVDVWINGEKVADDVYDWAVYYKYGTTYEINDIKTASGKRYDGLVSGSSLTGTVGDDYVDVRLIYVTLHSVQLVSNNGSGSGTQTIVRGNNATFTGVGPNAGYNDTNSVTCSNGQSATKSGTTVTVNNVTSDTTCTISFPIKTYSVTLTSTNGTGSGTKNNISHGSGTTFTGVGPNTGYDDTNSITCDNATVSKSGTTVTINNVTGNTSCAISFPIKKFSLSVTFAGSGVSSVKVCKTSGNCSGSNLVGTISTSGGSIANIPYNTTYYLYPAFTSGYQLDKWEKTSSTGSLSSTTASNPTFTIGVGNGAVKITGKGISYTITLDRNGGSGGSGSATAVYGSNMPNINVPSWNGWTFQGYYDAKSGGTKYYNANGTSARTWNKTGDTTLYARWADTTSPSAPNDISVSPYIGLGAAWLNVLASGSTDSGSGVSKYQVSRNGGSSWTDCSSFYCEVGYLSGPNDSYSNIVVRAVDGAGNPSTNTTVATNVTPKKLYIWQLHYVIRSTPASSVTSNSWMSIDDVNSIWSEWYNVTYMYEAVGGILGSQEAKNRFAVYTDNDAVTALYRGINGRFPSSTETSNNLQRYIDNGRSNGIAATAKVGFVNNPSNEIQDIYTSWNIGAAMWP